MAETDTTPPATVEGSYDWWRTEVAARDADLERLRAELKQEEHHFAQLGELYVHACRGAGERKSLRQRAEAAEAERDALKAAVAGLLTAQGRMLDDWAEANEDRRRELWQRLHEEADRVFEVLYAPESNADAPTPVSAATEAHGEAGGAEDA
jgi:hypothetical protein